MAPTPQEFVVSKEDVEVADKSGDRVVISGMSGLFPKSHHVKDLSEILYNKANPISSNPRWKYNHPEVAPYTGKVPELELFDAQFFKVHYRLSQHMDSMARKLLEQAYQAIYDAGISPEHLSGRKIGVYTGSCFCETEKTCFYVSRSRSGIGIAGCNKSMFANRVSYWLNAKGPSLSIDESCCSSMAALEQAYLAMTRGECEAAVVGGSNICLHPQSSVHYGRIMKLSMDGKTKSFDNNAAGCARSEAINVLFLQKAKDALRIYAEVIHVKSEFNSLLEGEKGPRYGFYRDQAKMTKFLSTFYEEAKVSPDAVEYVEAFGSAVPEADKVELDSITEVFCKNRQDQLHVGSVMSNIGYGEAAAGISAVTKVLLGYHKGKIAANLNCETPRQDVAGLRDGRMRIVTEHQPFKRTYAAVNGLAITGVNAHVLLHGHYKPKNPSRYKSNIPHLVTVSGRQETSVEKILNDLKSRPVDPEELALLHNIHSSRISGHLGRGFIILDTDENGKTVSLCEKAEYFDDVQRPLWFVYSGMGSQWAGMGAQLMRIPVFAAAIERCRRVLEPKGVDIVHIITSPDKTIFDNILNSFVGIAAIQIGLTDILRELGLVPEKIIGHSVGELGCAYADGCFTAEEMILAAYYRGLVSVQTPFIRGSMAAVGIGYKEMLELCPPEIEIACHNGPDSCTISGPANVMREFVAKLSSQKIFAKEVPCSNIAYHSRYIAEAGPGLLKYLSEVIKTPKLRSDRWVSTSVPQHKWNEPMAKYSSAEYHTNNLLNSVLFEETSQLIPSNAVLVEIAPHGLLQAILKRSLADTCHHIPLTRRGHSNGVQFLLEAIGKLYMEGYNLKIQAIYPKIEFPVSTETPMLSHLVEWAHNEQWDIPLYVTADRKVAARCKFVISIHDDEYKFMTGHKLRGTNSYPFAAALVAVWDTLAMTLGVTKKKLSVQFQDLQLHSQPILHDQRQLRLLVSLHRGSGLFEVIDEQNKIATGFIKSDIVDARPFSLLFESTEPLHLKSEDIYKLLFERDYDYCDEFQSLHCANESLTKAQLYWQNNWVTLIDGMLQLSALRHPHESTSQPTHIRKLLIDMKKHFNEQTVSNGDKKLMNVTVFDTYRIMRCGGVVIEDVKFCDLPPIDKQTDLKTLHFIPHFQNNSSDISNVLLAYLQIVAENVNKEFIKIIELLNYEGESEFVDLQHVLKTIPLNGTKYQHKIIYKTALDEDTNVLTDIDILLIKNLPTDDRLCQKVYQRLGRDTFVINQLNEENSAEDFLSTRPSTLYHVACAHTIKNRRLELIRWRPTTSVSATSAFTVNSSSDLAMLSSTIATMPSHHKVIVISSYPPPYGLKDLIQKFRKDRSQINLLMLNHKISDDQCLDRLPNLHLAFNILDHGKWGGAYYLPSKINLPERKNVTLQCSRIGDFNSLQWVAVPDVIGSGIKVMVHYAGLNNTDPKRCSGIIPLDISTENAFGMDFSGITKSGSRVMGLVRRGAVSSCVLARPELLWPVPAHWTLEEAATVPLAYCSAFYCLSLRRSFCASKSVLVHGGTGALGQAVIAVALGNGWEVFTTVSSVNKKRFLLKLFPDLKDDHIGNSRDATFGDMVLNATHGKGCSIVISCVKNELKNVSLKCAANGGITVDTNQIPTRDNFTYGMHSMTLDRSYVIIDLGSALTQSSLQEMKMMQLMLAEGITRGYVRPLSRVTYEGREAPRAFHLLANSQHRGRVLLQLRNSEHELLISNPEQLRLSCAPDLCQLIISDEDVFGIQMAEKLAKCGAKKIYFCCAKKTPYVNYKIECLRNHNVDVKVYNETLKRQNIKSLLEDCTRFGSLEGVYINAIDKTHDTEIVNIIKELDSASRKMYPKLKHFAVINNMCDVGLETCISRKHDRLPATMVKLAAIRNIHEDDHLTCGDKLNLRNAINAVEQALHSNAPAALAHARVEPKRSLLQQIAHLTGVNMFDGVQETDTLSDLGLGEKKTEFLCVFLRNKYNLSLTEEYVSNLTIKEIQDLENTLIDKGFYDSRGLETFYSYVDPDELLETTEMVFLQTLTNNSTMRDDEFDPSQTYMCVVPGLEGHHSRFSLLAERLKLPVIVLQPGLDRPNETVYELARRYAEILLSKTGLKQNFYLLGFESGVMVALEMAAILENHGLTGTVFCIGESPEDFQITLKEELKEFETDEALQLAVTRHMFSLMVGGDVDKLEAVLQRDAPWRTKIESCVRTLLGEVSHSSMYTRDIIECAYGRIKQALNYTLTPRALRSQLVLLRASKSEPNSPTGVNSLQQQSQRPLTVYDLRAPLAHSASDLRCSAIINHHLDPVLLSEFDKKNLCETYLINADTFMTMDSTPSSYED